PRPKRKSVSRRHEYTEGQIHHILYGLDFFGDGYGDVPIDDLVPHWEILRDTELPKWIKSNPGTRPPIWWYADSPEDRPLIERAPLYPGDTAKVHVPEPESDYLRRLGLMDEAEIAALNLKGA
ncbi:MAG: hypothetical protein HQ515_02915, partial [Phycisphaeraceae bacterium]|nr:hypothetical protein [Phycisphaeraceae bacterium]